jgi:hypothetical protein
VDIPVHRVLEEDGANDPLPVKRGAGNHAGAHFVHDGKHLILAFPSAFFNSV